MSKLSDFVIAHTERGECQCGRCIDKGDKPDPTGHTADVFFFKVAVKGYPNLAEFERLTAEHRGEFCEVNPLDGEEHNYMQLAGWIGDQGLAMQYMGLGAILGCWELMTPKMIPGLPEDLQQQMAGMGMVAIHRGKACAQEITTP